MSNGIGLRIKQLREEKGLTQQQLAKEMHVKRETVNQWENETRDLKTGYTISLAVFFGVTCDYILRGIKAENVDINRELGLSDQAITILKLYNQKEGFQNFIPTLNYMIELQRDPDLPSPDFHNMSNKEYLEWQNEFSPVRFFSHLHEFFNTKIKDNYLLISLDGNIYNYNQEETQKIDRSSFISTVSQHQILFQILENRIRRDMNWAKRRFESNKLVRTEAEYIDWLKSVKEKKV